MVLASLERVQKALDNIIVNCTCVGSNIRHKEEKTHLLMRILITTVAAVKHCVIQLLLVIILVRSWNQ